jgi:hypothetical protein
MGFSEESMNELSRVDGDFLTLFEVHQRTGLSPSTVTRRVRRGAVPIFLDRLDARKRLVRADDLDLLVEPWPISQTAEGGRPLQSV